MGKEEKGLFANFARLLYAIFTVDQNYGEVGRQKWSDHLLPKIAQFKQHDHRRVGYWKRRKPEAKIKDLFT